MRRHEQCDGQRIDHVKTLFDDVHCGFRVVMVHPSRLADELLYATSDSTLFTKSTGRIQESDSKRQKSTTRALDRFIIHDRTITTTAADLCSWLKESDGRSWHANYDDQLENVAVVHAPHDRDDVIARLAIFNLSHHAWFDGTADDIFSKLEAEFPKLVWTVRQGHRYMSWFSGKADGRCKCGSDMVHWYGELSEADFRSMILDSK